MIAVDTNILVRLLTGDDRPQTRVSQHLFRDNAVFIPETVLLETEWVLRDAYDLPASDINQALRKLLGLPGVSVRDERLLALALDWHAGGMDFADAMHLALSQYQSVLKTFDRQFIQQSAPGTQCTVEAP